MDKQNKSTGMTVLVVLLLIVTIGALVLATYAWAKYTTTISDGNATANVAKWNVTADFTNGSTWSQTYQHVVTEKMAPGTSGYIPVKINFNDTEVCADYTITLVSVTGNTPANLKFYGADESTGTTKRSSGVAATAVNNSVLVEGTYELDTHSAVNTSANSVTKYIYWEWPFETPDGDAQDTLDGQNAAAGDSSMTLTVKIDTVQVDPNGAHNNTK